MSVHSSSSTCSVVFIFAIIAGLVFCVFFFKQKTAYEMRISDWSSDVCSSDLRHAENLFAAYSADKEGRNWTYMGYGPFASPAALREWMEKSCLGADPLFHAVVDQRSTKALGVASYLRLVPPIGVIEVGHLTSTRPRRARPGTPTRWTLCLPAA